MPNSAGADVRTPDAFFRMPAEYQELVIHQLRAHAEGELSGADDYMILFYPIAPNALEKKVCCERAAEEMDHYIRAARVLSAINVDTSFMLSQTLEQREFYRTEGVKRATDWISRGLFSFIGEAAILDIIKEMSRSSYQPISEMCEQVIIDEHVHVANGHRIVSEYCETEEGLKQVQAALPKAWAVTLDLFGKSESKRSEQYVHWGLRQLTNAQARERFIKRITPHIKALGLQIPSGNQYRKFM
jgi:ring-1,2-phenylacetyl-CoA epoxidase subunit PaaA